MKKISFLLLQLILSLFIGKAQDYPVLSQIHTNTFLYNPSLAGGQFNQLGSIYFINRSRFSDVNNHPSTQVLCAHKPIKNTKSGIGASLFYDRFNVYKSVFLSAGYAYHLPTGRLSRLSMGLSGNLHYSKIDAGSVQSVDDPALDPEFSDDLSGSIQPNFSFGLHYQTQYFSIGGAINNIMSSIRKSNHIDLLTNYYSLHARGFIKISRNLIEPVVTVRQFPFSSELQTEFGLYYTYFGSGSYGTIDDKFFTFGVSSGTNSLLGFTAIVQVIDRIKLAFNYEIIPGNSKFIGNSNEIMLRYDFLKLNNSEWNSEYLKWNNLKHKLRNKIKK